MAYFLVTLSMLVMGLAFMALWISPWLAAFVVVAMPIASYLDGRKALQKWVLKRG